MIKCFYNSVLKFDFINKFNYLYLSNIPHFTKICFTFKSDNFKNMLLYSTILKIFSNKNSKILLSFKNGNVNLSKVFIKKKLTNHILLIIYSRILPYIKLSNFLTLYIYDIELIKKLFYNCHNLVGFTKLKITLIFNFNNKRELMFAFKNYLIT